jgi:hypothetical protein
MQFFKNILFAIPALFLSVVITSAQITPQEAVLLMQPGINLGNTLEPPNEGGWNNPPAQEKYFDHYKNAGFRCIRIPVRWDGHTGTASPYTISETWIKRVEQVIDWGLNRGLFVIINAHHEDWIKKNYSQANRDRFDSIWSQISFRFRNKPERLLFEIINEPYGLTKQQNDDLHQRVLHIIRKTNPFRIVVIQGHNWGGSDELIAASIPDDRFLMGSFHSYDPYLFGLEGQGTWGNAADYQALAGKFSKVREWSDQNNIPVVLGEYGAIRTCDYNSRMRHYSAYVDLAVQNGFAHCAWDDGGDFRILIRNAGTWEEIKDIVVASPDLTPVNNNPVVSGDSVIKITWTNRTLCDSVWVLRRSSGYPWTKVSALPGSSAVFEDIKPPMDQTYYYKISARDTSGKIHTSYPQRIYFPVWERRVRSLFLGNPHLIPGIIEAEDFDLGGEGIAYHETDGLNIAGAYRPTEAVDIYDRNGTGYHIGNAIEGEWLEYTVRVKTTGIYLVSVSIASMSGGGKFSIRCGKTESDTLIAPVTKSWLTEKNVVTTMKLDSGQQILRFSILSEPLFNIDRLTFELVTSASGIPLPGTVSLFAWQEIPGGNLLIRTMQPEPIITLSIYDVSGNMLRNITAGKDETLINAGRLPPGLFIIRAITNKKMYGKKIVVQ